MAERILTHPKTATPQYHLPEADRQAILQQSSSSKKLIKIEQQRLSFIKINGHDGLSLSA